MIGKRFGEFEVLEEIGSGGMGTVFKAWDSANDRHVALKVLSSHLLAEREFVNRFGREIAVLQQLNHENIANILAVGNQDNIPYYAMELVEGESLKARLAREGQPPIKFALRITEQVASALEHAHSKGIVHRDIKPANILLTKEGNAKITDFGIARLQDATQMTATGGIIGTVEYMAPEQAEGRQVDHRADIYSLGIVLYQMLTGSVPFKADTPLQVMQKHRFTLPEPPAELNPDIPPNVAQLIEKMLQKDPAHRITSAQAIINISHRLEDNIQLRAAAKTVVIDGARYGVRKPPRWWANRWGFIMVLLLLGIVLLIRQQTHRPAPEVLFSKGQDLYFDGRFVDAIKTFKQLVKWYPEADEASQAEERIITISDLRKRLIEERRRKFKAMTTLSPEAIDAVAGTMYEFGQDSLLLGKKDIALDHFGSIVKKYPDTEWAEKARKRIAEITAEEVPSP